MSLLKLKIVICIIVAPMTIFEIFTDYTPIKHQHFLLSRPTFIRHILMASNKISIIKPLKMENHVKEEVTYNNNHFVARSVTTNHDVHHDSLFHNCIITTDHILAFEPKMKNHVKDVRTQRPRRLFLLCIRAHVW